MTGIEDSRWVAVGALAAAMFATGFSFAAVACSNAPSVSVAEVARGSDSVSVPAPAASLGTVARIVNGAPSAVPSSSLATPDPGKGRAEIGTANAGLRLKRFVVTRKIANREPVLGDDFTLGSGPVYAFVEFENAAPEARNVRVMFQNQDTKATVGHVKLTVPGATDRFRTWGNTRLIRDAGHWIAVVSTADGVELGRAPFEIKG